MIPAPPVRMRGAALRGIGRSARSCAGQRRGRPLPSPPWLAYAFGALALAGCGEDEPGLAQGSPQTLSGTYAVGQNVRIVSPNGAVRAHPGSSAGSITATFSPFVIDATDADEASDAMSSSLVFGVDDGGNTVVISVSIVPGAMAGLGADVDVTLPTSFDGGFEVEQTGGLVEADLRSLTAAYTSIESVSGSVVLRGAGGQLELSAGQGDCSVEVSHWSTSNGSVSVAAGNLDFAVAPALSGRLDAQAATDGTGEVRPPSPLPAGWTSEELGPGHSRFAFGPDAAQMGTVQLSTAQSASSITLAVTP